MAEAFAAAILEGAPAEQLALLNAHPDLAGRAAIAGQLTEASRGEQAGAGLDRLTPAEFARFSSLNAAYRDRFGFPFILAVKGADKYTILTAFEARIASPPADEFRTALEQVCRIVRFRLEAVVAA
jgi:2-oxo-4-hydroxy-4-carboxy-5-ureidoimidazoline decarboxylase